MTSQRRRNYGQVQNSRFSVKYEPKLRIVLKKKMKFHWVFALQEKDMTFLILGFKTINQYFFFQNGDFLFSQVATTRPLPAIFDG